jgi:hypothetical protein
VVAEQQRDVGEDLGRLLLREQAPRQQALHEHPHDDVQISADATERLEGQHAQETRVCCIK